MTPIFIIAFDRYSYLKAQIERFYELGQIDNLIIIDNCSTYEPLLNYYEELKDTVKIIRCDENYGHKVLNAKPFYGGNPKFVKKYNMNTKPYAYTDCDILPSLDCPKNFLEIFKKLLHKYKDVSKIGFSLEINDIPDTLKSKDKVLTWESRFWENPIHDKEFSVKLYSAPIDTTFSIQRPGTPPGWYYRCLRVGYPYVAKHLSWYIDSNILSEEDQYYINTVKEKETHFPDAYPVI